MEKNKFSIATMTWARDEEEEKLLRSALPLLAALDVDVHITDGGSGEGFLAFLKSFPQFKVWPATEKGLWAQVKNSLDYAFKEAKPFILYTEPDKFDFFRDALPAFVERAQATERTGVVMASRSPLGFASFPAFQQMTETAINKCCDEITGMSADY